jgi:hypothetical protein
VTARNGEHPRRRRIPGPDSDTCQLRVFHRLRGEAHLEHAIQGLVDVDMPRSTTNLWAAGWSQE